MVEQRRPGPSPWRPRRTCCAAEPAPISSQGRDSRFLGHLFQLGCAGRGRLAASRVRAGGRRGKRKYCDGNTGGSGGGGGGEGLARRQPGRIRASIAA
eukprot:SAG22_NODE_2044_length_3089_cov_2.202341_5_plen_98_part_00